jgi:ssDNA-binding Zn-finger/Zn-ribbon topoisomerase 1
MKRPRNPRPDNKWLYNWDSMKVFRPLEHDLTNYTEWCCHLCADCKRKHYHKKGKFRPCMAPYVCGRCPTCRELLKIKQQLVNQGRVW